MAKKSFVKKMFSEIAGDYDKLNRIISLNLDLRWRKKAVKLTGKRELVLDICAGTGDMAMIYAQDTIPPKVIVLVDLSPEMLKLAKQKLSEISTKTKSLFIIADGESLPFQSELFDGVIMGFALRNLENIPKFMAELDRITKDNSEMVFLDIAHPENKMVSKLFYLYFYKFVPFFTKFITGKDYAYRYLPSSLRIFYKQKEFIKLLNELGFQDVSYQNILTGIGAIYRIRKRLERK